MVDRVGDGSEYILFDVLYLSDIFEISRGDRISCFVSLSIVNILTLSSN